jgi:tetratricopeptide (TPR) repeat protein
MRALSHALVILLSWATPFGAALEDVDKITPETAAKLADAYARLDTPSASRYFNLGNAAYLADRLPEAILAYRRGLQLDPNDAGLRDNLDYARAKVQGPFASMGRPEEDAWPPWLYQPSSWQVLMASLGLYSLACALLTRWFVMRRRALLVRAVVVFVLSALGGAYWLYLEDQTARHRQNPLVIVQIDRLPLRKGNGPSYDVNPDLPQLARGMEARRLRERGGWLQIQFAGGSVGWVDKAAALVDE